MVVSDIYILCELYGYMVDLYYVSSGVWSVNFGLEVVFRGFGYFKYEISKEFCVF